MNAESKRLLQAAEIAARDAARFLWKQEGSQKVEAWGLKGRHDFVTEVDREAERMIAAQLLEAFPSSNVMGEELTPDAGPETADGVTWIVDPLDGTTNFLHGYPWYAVSIAAMRRGELLAGAVHHVRMDALYTASLSGGAFKNGEPIHVSGVNDPGHAMIGTGFPFKAVAELDRYQRQFKAVMLEASGVRRAGSAALDLCDVAQGRFDGFWELILAPWDVAAGTLIVREAGGVVTDLEGGHDVIRHGPIVAGNARIHGWLMELLKAS